MYSLGIVVSNHDNLITAGRYGTLLTATRYGRITTNAVTRLSLLSKSIVTPPLATEHNKKGQKEGRVWNISTTSFFPKSWRLLHFGNLKGNFCKDFCKKFC